MYETVLLLSTTRADEFAALDATVRSASTTTLVAGMARDVRERAVAALMLEGDRA